MSGYIGASTSTGSGDLPTVSEVKDKGFQEFKRAIFTVDLIDQGTLQADPNDVQKHHRSSTNICLTRARCLKDPHFDPHGVEMREKVDSEKPLKPDILGLLRSHTPDELEISWNDVAIFVEVKSCPIDVVKRLATYAHRHLAVDRRRSFFIAIAFSHKALTLHSLCFHRSGVSISSPLHLDKEDGFRSVVEHMVGILSIRDEEAFGLDMTRVKSVSPQRP
ncbi:hypothetical protein BJY52DRAFT_1190201 [Lactarius psammicola]|nr:hypothetical protein BJY52DRAFT_1190201 [Lactarius psammicola]